MKNICTLLSLLLVTVTLSAQNIVTKDVGDFNELKTYDLIVVNLIQSNENKVVIKGYDAGEVQIVNKNGKLKIRMTTEKSFQGEDNYVEVYFKNIGVIDANEGSYVVANEMISQKQIELRAQEGATIKVGLETTQTKIRSVTGGIVKASGISDIIEVTLNTGGIYEGREFEGQNASVKITAAGEAEIHASQKLDVSITAGGDVYVYGDPEVINEKRLAGGRIKRVN